MHWQDIVISMCQIGFFIALIPSIRSHHKPAAITSIMNFVLVFIVATCLLTLELWFSAITAYLVDVSWLILAIQKVQLDRDHLKK